MTSETLEKQIEEWVKRNFPDTTPAEQLLGVVEELGELHHWVLKGKQKIRHSPAEISEGIEDAIGDLTIYLISYCNMTGKSFFQILQNTWNRVSQRNWKDYPKNGLTQ